MVQKIMVPPYFGPISCWKQIINSTILWDVHQNYIKQTYRNRTFIHSANGLQKLTVPVKHSKIKFSMLEAKIDNTIAWQKNHWRSIQSAYSSSPFFEFYKDDLQLIFEKKYKYLLDVTLDSFLFINDALDLAKNHAASKEYNDSNLNDFRHLASAKSNLNYNFEPYIQMFDDKYGFLENLSILDLLFMEGPNSISFLEKVNVTLK